MAAVVITANNTRVEDSNAITGWSSRGGGAGASAESILPYQGGVVVNRKITSSTGAGFEYDPASDSGSAQNMTTAALAHWMVKFYVTDFPDLRANDGVRIIIGDGTNEYAFITAGTDAIKNAYDEYILRASYIIIPVNPNISGYRDATHSSGTPSLTAVDQFGIDAEFITGAAKAENVALDAIDLGTGLTLTRGDGADADGDWPDFVSEDEGTVNNRWGYANSIYGGAVNIFFGTMTIGDSAGTNPTEFSGGAGEVNLWPDGLSEAGFTKILFECNNASDAYSDASTHISLGTTNIENTKLNVEYLGTSGTHSMSHKISNLRNYTIPSGLTGLTLDGADVECEDLQMGDATITSSTIRPDSASGVAMCNDFDFTNADNVTFIQSGSGHAIEITNTGSYTLDALFFQGFGANAANDAAIYNNSGGAVTLNISNNGDTPTYRNGTLATTSVVNTKTVKVTCIEADGTAIQNARVFVEADAGGDLPAAESVTITRSGATATVSHTAHGMEDGQKIKIRGADQQDYNIVATISNVTTNAYDYTVANSPTTPATGTITSSAVILDGLSNASGIVQDTAFNFSTNQPIKGRSAKSTTSPFFKRGVIVGTITSSGFDQSILMVDDE